MSGLPLRASTRIVSSEVWAWTAIADHIASSDRTLLNMSSTTGSTSWCSIHSMSVGSDSP